MEQTRHTSIPSLPSPIQNVDRAMMYEHEKACYVERPDMSYALSAASPILNRYPKQVRDCNDQLRVAMSVFTPYRYAWVHARDLMQRYVSPETHSVHWLPRVVQENRFYLCFLEPTTLDQQLLRFQNKANAYKHGYDFTLVSERGRPIRTELDRIPTGEQTQLYIYSVRQTLKQTETDRLYSMLKDMNRCKAAEKSVERIEELMPVRLPDTIDQPMEFMSDVRGVASNKLADAGIGESPVLRKQQSQGT